MRVHGTARKKHPEHRLVGAVKRYVQSFWVRAADCVHMYHDLGVAAAAWSRRPFQPRTAEKWVVLNNFAQVCGVGTCLQVCVVVSRKVPHLNLQ